MANLPDYEFWEFSKLNIFGIKIFFLIWKIVKILKNWQILELLVYSIFRTIRNFSDFHIAFLYKFHFLL